MFTENPTKSFIIANYILQIKLFKKFKIVTVIKQYIYKNQLKNKCNYTI